ncbi:MAG: low molecular weight protein-tyrosine-phosphatase [Acidobacteriota bacterium]
MPKSVLFVCMGNICRSPTGEGLLRHLAVEEGLDDRVEIESAGTIGTHAGAPPDARMRRAAERRGYRLEGSARRVVPSDFQRFDLIVAMDTDNLNDLQAAAPNRPRAEVRLLTSFLPIGAPDDVPDPYYGGDAGFETVLDMVEQACPAILEHLLDGGGGDPSTKKA